MPGSWPGTIAKHSRPRTQAVAGYDLTFSPVKSVSTLWAVADPAVAAVDRTGPSGRRAGCAAVHRSSTRCSPGPGRNGVRQVNVRGLVAAAFTHRDSRAGDPDLHTHVAVANKVQTLDGRWLSIDGRVLFKANVAASETYNTALEQHLRDSARGAVRRTARHRSGEAAGPGDRRRRPAAEPALVDPAGQHRGPPRRAGRPVPARSRPAADPGRSAAAGAAGHLGNPRRQARTPHPWPSNAPPGAPRPPRCSAARRRSHAMVRTALDPTRRRPPGRRRGVGGGDRRPGRWRRWRRRRSTWQIWHVRAEAQRQVRAADVPAEQVDGAGRPARRPRCCTHRSVRLGPADDGIERTGGAAARRRVVGLHGRRRPTCYTSPRILAAEQRLVATAGRTDGRVVDADGGRAGAAGDGRQRDRPGCRAGRPGPADGHLRGPAAAGDRPGRRREDHRHARPRRGLDRQTAAT